MDLGGWLRSLGLERYEAAFRENEIDQSVLASLTHETLKEIGVTAVGHRLKLLDAIAALRTDAGAKSPSTGSATASATPSVPAEDRANPRKAQPNAPPRASKRSGGTSAAVAANEIADRC
jgi:SAM domain (Sterile alpha motif)